MTVYKIVFDSVTTCPVECVGVVIDGYIQICEVIQ
jgi:hypothetical protein